MPTPEQQEEIAATAAAMTPKSPLFDKTREELEEEVMALRKEKVAAMTGQIERDLAKALAVRDDPGTRSQRSGFVRMALTTMAERVEFGDVAGFSMAWTEETDQLDISVKQKLVVPVERIVLVKDELLAPTNKEE